MFFRSKKSTDSNFELYNMAIEEVFILKEERDNLQNTLNHCDPNFFEVLNEELTAVNTKLNSCIKRAKLLGQNL